MILVRMNPSNLFILINDSDTTVLAVLDKANIVDMITAGMTSFSSNIHVQIYGCCFFGRIGLFLY